MIWDIFQQSFSVGTAHLGGGALCSLLVFQGCLSPPLSRTFQGNSHDESAERGEFVNVSNMLRGIWEWSAITQTRSTEGGDRAPNFRGGRRGSQKLSSRCTTFILFVTEYRKYIAITFPLINTLCVVTSTPAHALLLVFVFVCATCKPVGYL